MHNEVDELVPLNALHLERHSALSHALTKSNCYFHSAEFLVTTNAFYCGNFYSSTD